MILVTPPLPIGTCGTLHSVKMTDFISIFVYFSHWLIFSCQGEMLLAILIIKHWFFFFRCMHVTIGFLLNALLTMTFPAPLLLSRHPIQRRPGAWPENGLKGNRSCHPAGICQWKPWLGQHPHPKNSGAVLQSLGGRLFQLLGKPSPLPFHIYVIGVVAVWMANYEHESGTLSTSMLVVPGSVALQDEQYVTGPPGS